MLPLELFHEAGKPLTQEGWADKLYREDEVKSSGGLAMADEKFSVVVTTTFEHDDIGDFHFKEEAHGLPRGKFQPIWVAHNDGTVPKE